MGIINRRMQRVGGQGGSIIAVKLDQCRDEVVWLCLLSGVGISFGADRVYDVLLETNKFPAELGASTRVLFANFGEPEAMHCLKLLRQVREAGIAAELYPDALKMAKQFQYADDKGIPFVAIIGGNEMTAGTVTIKDMKTGEQKVVKQEELLMVVG